MTVSLDANTGISVSNASGTATLSSTLLSVNSIAVGDADTTLTRASAGVVSVGGVNLLTTTGYAADLLAKLLTVDGSGSGIDADLVKGGATYPIVAGTAVATTSGTSVDFTGIPSWVKRITIILSGVSTSGVNRPFFQIGDSGGVETSGYIGTESACDGTFFAVNHSPGFYYGGGLAANLMSGVFWLVNLTGNTWVIFGITGFSNVTTTGHIAGYKTLSATLDRVRLTSVTDTYDAGTANIHYE